MRKLWRWLNALYPHYPLKPVVGVHPLDFDLFDDQPDQALWCFEMRDARRPLVTLGGELQLHLMELRKADRLGLVGGPLAAWIALFEHWRKDDIMALVTGEPVRAAFDKLNHLSGDSDARRLAFVRERALRDWRTVLREAREEGLSAGLQHGLEQGVNQGRTEGEQRAARRTAANLIEQTALDDAAIAAATGLDPAAVAALRHGAR